MSIRFTLLLVIVAGLIFYSRRDWLISLFGLVIISAIMGHPDMPRSMLGIPGLNVWNLLFLCIGAQWLIQRHRLRVPWDMPKVGKTLLWLYIGVSALGVIRMLIDTDSFPTAKLSQAGMFDLTNEYVLNSLKYLMPGLMLFDGCRTRKYVIYGLIAAMMMGGMTSFLVIRTVPISGLRATGKQEMMQRRRIGKKIGYHANSVAMICAGTFWGVASGLSLRKGKWFKLAMLAMCAVAALAVLLCRSRAGYGAMIGIGVIFAMFLWRRLLVLMPIMTIVVVTLFPGVRDRMLMGFGLTDPTGDEVENLDVISAGRTTDIWPVVVEQIEKNPVIGFGRLAMYRTPIYRGLLATMGYGVEHPHNAYLGLVLDTGVLGAVFILGFYGLVAWMSLSLALDKRDPLFRAVGGASLAAVLALLIMAVSGQSFWLRENHQMALCLYGLALRVWVERRKVDVRVAARPAAMPVRRRVTEEACA